MYHIVRSVPFLFLVALYVRLLHVSFSVSWFIKAGGKVLGKVLDQIVYSCTSSMFIKL